MIEGKGEVEKTTKEKMEFMEMQIAILSARLEKLRMTEIDEVILLKDTDKLPRLTPKLRQSLVESRMLLTGASLSDTAEFAHRARNLIYNFKLGRFERLKEFQYDLYVKVYRSRGRKATRTYILCIEDCGKSPVRSDEYDGLNRITSKRSRK